MNSSLRDEITDKGLNSHFDSTETVIKAENMNTGAVATSGSVFSEKNGRKGPYPSITTEAALDNTNTDNGSDTSKISAYARLDFEQFTFFVQTLQIVLGRKSNDELINGSQHSVDVHLSSKKAISRRHAKIFYNFGTQRFELSILGRNGAFVDDLFIEKGMTIPLVDGTKIQIGDITFQFVLPSLEGTDAKTIPSNKPFNPSDAIILRSSLYSNSNSPTKTTKSTPEPRRKSISRLKSGKPSVSIPRRLSEARRKSLSTATNEEITSLLHELGVRSLHEIEDIDENDPSFVDAQIRAILGDGAVQGESAIMDDDEEDDIFAVEKDKSVDGSLMDNSAFESFNDGEEDELDKLVKQHNLEQGVEIDETALDGDELSVIDEEIASLAPLIAHNEDKEKAKYTSQQLNRSGPLMGRPAPPRMGKPASIQPSSSRLYGRSIQTPKPQHLQNQHQNQVIDSRLQAISSPINGLPTHLVAQGPNDYSLKLSQGYNQQTNQFSSYNKPFVPARPPAPELLVPIQTIEQKPSPHPEIIIDKITVTATFTHPPIHIPKILGKPGMVPKIPKRRKEAAKKPVKNVYQLNDIPEHYRTKPTLSFAVMIVNVLKQKPEPKGLTIGEIHEGIKEVYPYYKYCPDGWQGLVIHNVKLNKLFKLVEHPEEDRWIIDDSFVQEKEKVKKKQQEIAAQRAKEAALRAEELKQKQRLDLQQSISQNIVGRDFNYPHNNLLSQTQLLAQLHQKNPATLYQSTVNGQKPKTIAEIASEIRREGTQNSKTPMYFKPQVVADEKQATPSISPSNIKAQLAANRSQYSSSPSTPTTTNSRPQSPSMNQDTKKSLTYLQKELFTLYKARKLSYNTATTTEIITKALATTIAQVNAIGSKAGVGDNALSFLVERAPQQVSKILDIALTKSIKEKQGILTSRPNSRGTTPGPSQLPSPKKVVESPVKGTTPLSSSIVKEANKIGTERLQEKEEKDIKDSKDSKDSKDGASLGKPPSFKSKQESPVPTPLSRPSSGTMTRVAAPVRPSTPTRPPTSMPSRPQSFGKPQGISKPPQFVSNKPPTRPGYGAKPERKEEDNKRPHEGEESPNKIIKLD